MLGVQIYSDINKLSDDLAGRSAIAFLGRPGVGKASLLLNLACFSEGPVFIYSGNDSASSLEYEYQRVRRIHGRGPNITFFVSLKTIYREIKKDPTRLRQGKIIVLECDLQKIDSFYDWYLLMKLRKLGRKYCFTVILSNPCGKPEAVGEDSDLVLALKKWAEDIYILDRNYIQKSNISRKSRFLYRKAADGIVEHRKLGVDTYRDEFLRVDE